MICGKWSFVLDGGRTAKQARVLAAAVWFLTEGLVEPFHLIYIKIGFMENGFVHSSTH